MTDVGLDFLRRPQYLPPQVMGRRPAATALIAFVVLVCFGIGTFAASSFHTDDGCAIELHCFACRWAFTTAAILTVPDISVVPIGICGRLEATEALATSAVVVLQVTARAPPAAPLLLAA